MTEDSSYVVQKPRKRTDAVEIADFTMLVRIPDRQDLCGQWRARSGHGPRSLTAARQADATALF